MARRNLGVLCLIFVAAVTHGEAGKTISYPVEVVFRDAAGDRMSSDGLGAYLDGVDGVQAKIDSDRGRLSFHACAVSAKNKVSCPGPRAVLLDFGHLATDVLGNAAEPAQTALGLPFVTGFVDFHSAVNPVDINAEGLPEGLLGMTEAGQQVLAGMKVNFADQTGLLFTIRLSPNVTADSNFVLITFNGVQIPCDDTVPCASWTIETRTGQFTDPGDLCCPTNELDDIGTLLSDNTNDEGDYHLPFLITITALPQTGGGGRGGR